MKCFTQNQWCKMVDSHMSRPVPLNKADLTKPFVYQRGYGVFYVSGGYHPSAMSLLLAFNHGYRNGVSYANDNNLEYSQGAADQWLRETDGAAFLSSVGDNIQVGNNLNMTEQRYFLEGQVVFS